MESPPKPPERKSLRFAVTLNLLFPGAGLFYLGRRWIGSLLALTFTACFVGALTIFLRGYSEYLGVSVSGDILQEGTLEHLAEVFHVPWLIGLVVSAAGIYFASLVGLSIARRRL